MISRSLGRSQCNKVTRCNTLLFINSVNVLTDFTSNMSWKHIPFKQISFLMPIGTFVFVHLTSLAKSKTQLHYHPNHTRFLHLQIHKYMYHEINGIRETIVFVLLLFGLKCTWFLEFLKQLQLSRNKMLLKMSSFTTITL